MIFTKMGKAGTEETARIAIQTAKERGIRHIVIASSTGYTAQYFKNCGVQVTVVTLAYGSRKPGQNVMDETVRQQLKDDGFAVCTAAHALSAGERSISTDAGGMYPLELIAHTLYMLSQGAKVCVECAAMALDGGYIPYGEDIVAVGGTGHGADTAVVLRPGYSKTILKSSIKDVLCLPDKSVLKEEA
ncbi:pyruvate kinase alpha/beta domain-containing protein [Neobittarella massiliensis]|uniref:pyruvate kinase alpha/beta domain-containing protein n=1 Tax=Neobittarella massiliensis (ex Bilen et al. 2018) TaxID=2041842 RepID=UPI000CF6396B|nr:pyruvate kinase alpha/beta domain-containing protein [Neobittarella massiliensis]